MASLNLILLSLAWAFRPLWIQQFDNNSVTTLLHKRRYPAYDTITLDGCSPPVNNHPFTIVAHPLDLIMRLRHPSRWPRPLPWIPGRLRPVRILNRLKTSCARSFAFRGDYLICSFLSIAILLRTLLHHGRRSSSIFCISHIGNPPSSSRYRFIPHLRCGSVASKSLSPFLSWSITGGCLNHPFYPSPWGSPPCGVFASGSVVPTL